MFLHAWTKYIPVIRILLKRSLNEEQKLSLNSSDFLHAAGGRKAKYDFYLSLYKGKLQSVGLVPPVGKDLVDALKNDNLCDGFIKKHHVDFSMTNKFELLIRTTLAPVAEITAPQANEQLGSADDNKIGTQADHNP
jgi:hypothetical protein